MASAPYQTTELTGRKINAEDRSVTYSAADDAAAAAIVRNCLQRRATAPKRIGVPYQIRELCDPLKDGRECVFDKSVLDPTRTIGLS